jgi:WD40 repeat protein
VIAFDAGGRIRLWDTAGSGQWIGDPRPAPSFAVLDFDADGRDYLVGLADQLELRSVADDRLLLSTRSPGPVRPALSADGRRLAVCPSGGAPKVWDVARGRTVSGGWEQAHGACDDSNSAVVLGGGPGGSGGDRLAVVSATAVRVWDTTSGREVAYLEDPREQDAVFSPDGAFLATADHTEIRIWRLAAPGGPVFRQPISNQRLSGHLTWDAARPVLRYVEGGTVHSLDLAAAVTPEWRSNALNNVVLSPDGRTFVTAQLPHSRLRSRGGTPIGSTYTFQLRDTGDGHVIRTLPAPPFPVSLDRTLPVVPEDTMALMAFSPDGAALTYGVSAPGSQAAPLRFTVWDLAHDRARTTLDLAASQDTVPVISVALGPDGRRLYAARTLTGDDPTDEVWDSEHPGRAKILTGLSATHLAVRPDGRLLVGDNRTTGLPTGRVTEHDLVTGQEIGALAFGLDGSQLAVGDQTGRVALWDSGPHVREGLLANVFPAPLGGSKDPEAVSALALSPDGRTLAVGGDAGTLQLWDLATQHPLGGRLTTPGDPVVSLAFSSDSGTLYASGVHVPLQRYTVAPSRAVTRVCARTGTDLTRAQWHAYVPDVPYRKVCAAR